MRRSRTRGHDAQGGCGAVQLRQALQGQLPPGHHPHPHICSRHPAPAVSPSSCQSLSECHGRRPASWQPGSSCSPRSPIGADVFSYLLDEQTPGSFFQNPV